MISEMRKQRGFSLIELLIVIAIILIIAAIAVPALLRARISSNEAAAAATIRTINSSQATYNTTYPGNFGSLQTLGANGNLCPAATSTGSCLLDNVLGCGAGASGVFCTKDNYKFTITVTNAGADYEAFGTALGPSQGAKDFCSGTDFVVHFSIDNVPPGATVGTSAACSPYSAL